MLCVFDYRAGVRKYGKGEITMAVGITSLNRASVTRLDVQRADFPDEIDDYKTLVTKYIPAEVVAFYQLFAVLVLEGYKSGSLTEGWFTGLFWAVFLAGLFGTPAYLIFVYKLRQRKFIQLIMSTIAFIIWAASLGTIPYLGFDYPILAAQVLLGIFTLIAPAFDLAAVSLKTTLGQPEQP
jgi:hypothetical protein